MLQRARRPIVLAGLQACAPAAAAVLRAFVDRTGCPVLTTYKAKGVVPEAQPAALGHYIGGVAEEPVIRAADLIVHYGFDPVEGPPQPWRYDAPVLEITEHAFDRALLAPQVCLVGDLAASLREAGSTVGRTAWTVSEIANQKQAIRAAAASGHGSELTPQQVVEAVRAGVAADARITIDAGAHMLPVLHLWECAEPRQALISRGLATMGFALPAAIGACLTEPGRPVVAFTGDGGLMMCLGELGTAMQAGCKPLVVVFNDSSLALIGDKQRRRQFGRAGVDFSTTDFASVARGFGWTGYRVADSQQLADAVARAVAAEGPVLIDAEIDAETYHAQIMALRG
jgi:acetolactate synthase-1/2/3 large subunit